jgi:hypothetical protein
MRYEGLHWKNPKSQVPKIEHKQETENPEPYFSDNEINDGIYFPEAEY